MANLRIEAQRIDSLLLSYIVNPLINRLINRHLSPFGIDINLGALSIEGLYDGINRNLEVMASKRSEDFFNRIQTGRGELDQALKYARLSVDSYIAGAIRGEEVDIRQVLASALRSQFRSFVAKTIVDHVLNTILPGAAAAKNAQEVATIIGTLNVPRKIAEFLQGRFVLDLNVEIDNLSNSLLESLRRQTPIGRTGRARNGWSTSLVEGPTPETELNSVWNIALSTGKYLVLKNSAPYVKYLNLGTRDLQPFWVDMTGEMFAAQIEGISAQEKSKAIKVWAEDTTQIGIEGQIVAVFESALRDLISRGLDRIEYQLRLPGSR